MLKCVVVGGGTAGWLSALYAQKHIPYSDVTVIASSDIGILGAGEGTTPHILPFLKEIDIKYVIIGGLVFDYCVSATAKDAARLGKRSNTIFVIGLQKFINFILSFI